MYRLEMSNAFSNPFIYNFEPNTSIKKVLTTINILNEISIIDNSKLIKSNKIELIIAKFLNHLIEFPESEDYYYYGYIYKKINDEWILLTDWDCLKESILEIITFRLEKVKSIYYSNYGKDLFPHYSDLDRKKAIEELVVEGKIVIKKEWDNSGILSLPNI